MDDPPLVELLLERLADELLLTLLEETLLALLPSLLEGLNEPLLLDDSLLDSEDDPLPPGQQANA